MRKGDETMEITVEQVWDTVDSVLGKTTNTAVIDGAFSFAVHEPGFVDGIRAARQSLFGSEEPPYTDDEDGRMERGRWVQNFDWHLKAIPESQYAQRHDQFYGSVKRLSEEYNVPSWAVDHCLFFGVPPTMSPIRAFVHESPQGAVSLDIRILSSDVTGEQLGRFYNRLRERAEIPALSYDRPPDDGQPQTVRTWAVHVLSNHVGMDVEEAEQLWDERYPAHPPERDHRTAFRDVLHRIQGVIWGHSRLGLG